MAFGAEKLSATKQQEHFIPSSSSSTIMPIDQRKWNDILAVGNVNGKSFKILKKMTRILQHPGFPLENDGAIEWKRLLLMFCRDRFDAPKWTNQIWIDDLK